MLLKVDTERPLSGWPSGKLDVRFWSISAYPLLRQNAGVVASGTGVALAERGRDGSRRIAADSLSLLVTVIAQALARKLIERVPPAAGSSLRWLHGYRWRAPSKWAKLAIERTLGK
ncbi:hypothetical protein [Sphingomonas sp. 10B4]|uniref:hypothetical protein n=1 Tax=Sphingomonas sp. 10B4 TaxID=3048575 RepID=UPI002AB42012|nr:hypothetical protein [Sphingomonas sp. 10B4]MDY7522650.1 hypothetical protein [Sphingomonas sp. 10B4]MEB0281793.1 hypothetical protein [Sphingomonas sp. 10B4]